jgi:hypothetical protein
MKTILKVVLAVILSALIIWLLRDPRRNFWMPGKGDAPKAAASLVPVKKSVHQQTAEVEKLFKKQKMINARAKSWVKSVADFAQGDPAAEVAVKKFASRMEPMLLMRDGGYMHLAKEGDDNNDPHLSELVPFVFIDPEVSGPARQFPQVAVLYTGSAILYRIDAPIHDEVLMIVLLHAISTWSDSEALSRQKVATPLDTTAQHYAKAKIITDAYARECTALNRAKDGLLEKEIAQLLLDEHMFTPAGYPSYVTLNARGMQRLQDVIFSYGVAGEYEQSLQTGILFTCVMLQQAPSDDERVKVFDWLFLQDGGANVKRLASLAQ